MTPAQRIAKIETECSGVLRQIEQKAFGGDDD